MSSLSLVMLGGAFGAALRAFGPGWPWGTLLVNVVGAALMGLLVGALARTGAAEGWRLFLGVGVLGGFTTFSAFSLDVVMLAERGALLSALGYALASVVGSVAALVAGLALVRAAA